MKKATLMLFQGILFTVFLISVDSCKKNKTVTTCGCNSDSVTYILTNTVGTLGYLNNQYQQAWFVNIKFPYNGSWLCKICNLDKAKNIINSLSQNDTVSVKVTGKLYQFCSDEYIGYTNGIVVPYHIILDSLKRN